MKRILAVAYASSLLLAVMPVPELSKGMSWTASADADGEPITPIPLPPPADPRKLALGERLFSDTRLSADGTLACSSCHDLRTNGAHAGRRANPALGELDTLTVFNAALSYRLTWEGRYHNFADQAEASIGSTTNMRSKIADVVPKLQADMALNNQFRAAYGRDVDRDSLLDAISIFEKSLLTPDSRFDRWLGGESSALSPAELKGYEIFKGFGCSACHQGVNIGGNLIARQGIFHPLVAQGPLRVRVPSLRNVAVTGPYFHDGSAATLDDAVRRMAAAQLDRTLNDEQVAALVAFLGSLTGNYRGKPVTGVAP